MVISLFRWFFAWVILFPIRNSPDKADSASHPFYTSVTEINYNQSSKSLEISCRFFSNDMENCLEKRNHSKVDMGSQVQKQSVDQMLMTYIVSHLQIRINKQPLVLQWVGREVEADASWLYLQASCPDLPKQVSVTNSLLYDVFNTQINIIHVAVSNDRKSVRLNYPDAQADFTF